MGFFNLFGASFNTSGDENLIRQNLGAAKIQLYRLALTSSYGVSRNSVVLPDGTGIECINTNGIKTVNMFAPEVAEEVVAPLEEKRIPLETQDYSYIPMILLYNGIGPVYPDGDIDVFPDKIGWAIFPTADINDDPVFFPYDEDSEGGINTEAIGQYIANSRGLVGDGSEYACERLGPIDYSSEDYDGDWEVTFEEVMAALGLPLNPGYPDYIEFYFDVQFKISNSKILHFLSVLYARDDGQGGWALTDCYAMVKDGDNISSIKATPTAAEQEPYIENPDIIVDPIKGPISWFPDAWPTITVGDNQYHYKAHAGYDDDNYDGVQNKFPVGREVVRFTQLK